MQGSSGAAFVTGGSSGIGFAAALRLARLGSRVAIFARDKARLTAAVDAIRSSSPGCVVHGYAVDVADQNAVKVAVAAALVDVGVPNRVVLSAGMTLPGRTDMISIDAHRRVMDVNYFGCLHMILALAPHIAPGCSIGLVGSSSGLVGTYGYGAYAPSKFALKGLAEVLRVEFAPRGIWVTLCMPPDTDTPMLQAELLIRPEVTSRMAEGAGVMRADDVAKALLDAMERRRFLVLPGLAIKLLYLFGPWIAPFLRRKQAKLIEEFGE